jgi:hypothetical protein
MMSNEISLFQQAVPDYIKEAGVDELTKALGGGGGLKRISIRGSVFRMMVGGEEIAKNESRSMNVVVVNGTKYVSRKFYAGKYVPGESAPPDCWSNDGLTPDASIEAPQHSNCENCPQNIKGSGQGDSRACRYEKRLAVVLADDIKGSVYQLLLPSKSYFGKGDLEHMPFEQYAKYVSSQGYNINMLVTEMKFDSDSDNPKLTFKPVGFLNKDQWEVAKTQGNTPEAKSAIMMTAAHTDAKPKAIAIAAPAVKAEAVVEAPAAEIPEPTKKASKKSAEEPTAKKDLASIMGQWATDDE